MSYDGIFTHVIVNELNTNLKDGRISKIYQPFQNEILMTIRANRKNKQLLLSAHPSYARIQLTEETLSNPEFAPNFCMFLRKNIEGATFEEIKQLGNDRIVIFKIRKFDEIGDLKHLLLIVELMGRHSNIFLVNEETNIIMDCLKHVPFYQNTYRAIHPGAEYVLPPHQNKLNPFAMDKIEGIKRWEQSLDLGSPVKRIQTIFQGLGKDSAKEILHLVDSKGSDLPEALSTFKDSVLKGPPALFTDEKGKQTFAPYLYNTAEGTGVTFDSPSEMLDNYYVEKATTDRIRQVASDLLGLIRTEIQKNKLKIKKLEQSLADSESADLYRIKGEVLTAYLYQVEKGASHVTLPNFYDEEHLIKIDLNPSLSASQNAQKYFSKYHKLVNSVQYIQDQLRKTKKEDDYLETIETQIILSDPQDLEEIREELKDSGYLKSKRNGKKKKVKVSKPYHFRSTDGVDIRVGKNNIQNDQLTLKTARKNHIWLHAKDIPGSHVIVEDPEPSEQTLLEAAIIAAYYSKFQQSANVPVDYVAVKQVHKPNAAKPGFVIYTGQKTLFVDPSKEIVEQLKVK